MSVDQSGGLRMDIGVLYLSHAMLVVAELIVCSMRGFACILAKWFWPTEVRLDSELEVGIFARRAMVDQAREGLCYQ